MAVDLINNGDGTTTLQIEHTAETAKVVDTMTDAVHELYDRGFGAVEGVAFEDLTVAQKKAICQAYDQKVWQGLARTYNRRTAVEAATEVADAEDKYI